jgi:hypothetical protein
MNRAIDKKELKRLEGEIRKILVHVWDPIGVKNEPNAQDEYDCCLWDVFRLRTTQGTDEEITEYLFRQGTEHMGLDFRREELQATVHALRKIRLSEKP